MTIIFIKKYFFQTQKVKVSRNFNTYIFFFYLRLKKQWLIVVILYVNK